MLSTRRELRLGSGSLAWLDDWCTGSSLAYLNGETLVVINLNHEPMDLPAGSVLLRSSPESPDRGEASVHGSGAFHRLGSNETVWMKISLEDSES
jgi:alpha-glucosidase